MMRDEPYIHFLSAAEEIHKQLELSRGAAQKRLREVCASGDIRVWKEPYSSTVRGEPHGEGPPEFVNAAEWRATEVDQATDEDGCHYWVRLSEEDFEYWLSQQKKPRAKPLPRKRALAKQAISELWADGIIPETVTNKEIEKQVGEWIAEDCKQKNMRRQPEISRDTILRAAGRKNSAAK
jgi:hypothetical protein